MPVLPLPTWILISLALGQLFLAAVVWRRDFVPGKRAFAGMMAAAAVYVLANSLELVPALGAQAALLKNLEYVGIVFIPPLTILFYASYTGKDGWLTRRMRLGLFALAFLNLAMKWTDGWHHLVIRELRLETSGGVNLLHVVRGPWYLVVNAYTLTAMITGVAVIVRTWPAANRTYRRHLLALGAAIVLPTAIHLLRLSGLNPWPGLDPVPGAMIVGMLGIAWTIWHDRLMRIAPVARDLLFDLYPGGIVVADSRRSLVDANREALRLLGATAEASVGRPLARVFAPWPAIVSLCGSETRARCEFPAAPNGTESHEAIWLPMEGADGCRRGFLLALHNIAERKAHERQLRELLADRTRDWQRATSAALKAGEEEQDRIGRELQESLGQELVGAARGLRSLASEFSAQPDVGVRLYEAADQVGELARRACNLAHLLARPDLTRASMREFIEAHLSQLEQTLGLACELTIAETFPDFDAERTSHLLRIIREAVINASQHAGARRVWIDCLRRGDLLDISISSDGTPMPAIEELTEGLGLRQMRMRASLLGASFSIEPGTGGAALVRLLIRHEDPDAPPKTEVSA